MCPRAMWAAAHVCLVSVRVRVRVARVRVGVRVRTGVRVRVRFTLRTCSAYSTGLNTDY